MTPAEASEGIEQAVEKIVTGIHQQVKAKGTRVTNALRNAELEVLKGQRSGKKYRKPFSKVRYTASAPGESPARRTGALRLGWIGGVEAKLSSHARKKSTIKVTAYIESNLPYAGYLEEGTERMAARPYVEKIKEKAQPEIENIMKKDYG